MSLPKIPDEAFAAVCAEFHPESEPCDRFGASTCRAAVILAWQSGHLYAAALRHAAERADATGHVHVERLLHMADEAVS